MTIPFWRNDNKSKLYELKIITNNMKDRLQILKNNTWDQNSIETLEKLIDRLEQSHLELLDNNLKSFFKKG